MPYKYVTPADINSQALAMEAQGLDSITIQRNLKLIADDLESQRAAAQASIERLHAVTWVAFGVVVLLLCVWLWKVWKNEAKMHEGVKRLGIVLSIVGVIIWICCGVSLTVEATKPDSITTAGDLLLYILLLAGSGLVLGFAPYCTLKAICWIIAGFKQDKPGMMPDMTKQKQQTALTDKQLFALAFDKYSRGEAAEYSQLTDDTKGQEQGRTGNPPWEIKGHHNVNQHYYACPKCKMSIAHNHPKQFVGHCPHCGEWVFTDVTVGHDTTKGRPGLSAAGPKMPMELPRQRRSVVIPSRPKQRDQQSVNSSCYPQLQRRARENIKYFSRQNVWGMIGLYIVTLGCYTPFWLRKTSRLVSGLLPSNPVSRWYFPSSMILMILNFGMAISTGSANDNSTVQIIGQAIGSTTAIVFLAWAFALRDRINFILGSEKKSDTWFSAFRTFLFLIIYIQLKINEIKAANRSDDT